MVGWNVFLDNELVTTIFFTPSCDEEYVKRSLIRDDKYPERIVVKKSGQV